MTWDEFENTILPRITNYWPKAEVNPSMSQLWFDRCYSSMTVADGLAVVTEAAASDMGQKRTPYLGGFRGAKERALAGRPKATEHPCEFWRRLMIARWPERRHEFVGMNADEIELCRVKGELDRSVQVYGPNSRTVRMRWRDWQNRIAARKAGDRVPLPEQWDEDVIDSFRQYTETIQR
jgi:hypothetical protein